MKNSYSKIQAIMNKGSRLFESTPFNDLRYYNLVVKGTNIVDIELREVSVPEMKYITKAIKDYNIDAWALGSSINQDNKQEDFFIYEYKILLNMKDMSQVVIPILIDPGLRFKLTRPSDSNCPGVLTQSDSPSDQIDPPRSQEIYSI